MLLQSVGEVVAVAFFVPLLLGACLLAGAGLAVAYGLRVATDRPWRTPGPSDPRSVGTGLLAVVTILATLLVVDAALFGRPDRLGGPADGWLTILRGAAILGGGQATVACFVLYRTVLSGLASTIRRSPASPGAEQPRK